MFSGLTIGIVLGIGVAAWVYAKLQRYTGHNTQSSLTGAIVVGLLACLVTTTAYAMLF